MSIRDSLIKILEEYPNARQEEFSRHPLAHYIRHNLPETLIEAAKGDAEKYIFKGSAGQGNWARGPWVAIFNPIITTSAQRGFYPVYLFREDMEGVYLSLNQAMTEQKNQYKADAKTVLKARAGNFRAILGPQTGRFKNFEIDLTPTLPSNDTAFYEAGNILARYYSINLMPSEGELIEDLGRILDLYEDLISGEAAFEAESVFEGDEPENIQYEDASKLRLHKRIERNPKLVKKAKQIHGYTCQVCDLNFEKKYGEIGKDYIEAHHLEPIAQLKGKKVSRDPKRDFAVLCSNCHRMIHKSAYVGDIEKFKINHLKDSE
jgi:5-methylcytosine-specific restriction protein A